MVVVTLWVWFHGPAGEEVTHGIVANVLRHCAKLEEIPGERRRRRGGGGKGGRERRMERRGEVERREGQRQEGGKR